MAIQNDNTLVTKGDLKELYTDKIAPYLGGGISYYQCDRDGNELGYAYLRPNAPQTLAISNNWQKLTCSLITGTFKANDGGIIIPSGKTVHFTASMNSEGIGGSTSVNITTALRTDLGVNIAIGTLFDDTKLYNDNGLIDCIWTNDTGADRTVYFGCTIVRNLATPINPSWTHWTVEEIGRIVDPVKYVSNNSDLQETPVGNIISYMGNSVPKHYLACDGTTYSIGSYPELEAFIIDEFGSINYFGGDGASTWAVPDLRGEFLRGAGTNGRSQSGDGANVGIHQPGTGINPGWVNNQAGGFSLPITPSSTYYSLVVDSGDKYVNTGTRKSIASTTSLKAVADTASDSGYWTVRPTNTSVKYCIKYESTYHAFFSNAAYKVSVAASVASHSGAAIAITLDNSDIIGDASLVSGNSFIAPLNGLYLIGMNWSNNGVWEQNYIINVNGTDVYHVVGIGVTDMLQLQKGDVVTIKTSKTSAQSGRASFALVTSNYNPTIVSADSVYSENEQMIGYWKDGKPLYQKTLVFNNITITPTQQNLGDISSLNIDYGTIVDVNGYENGDRYFLNSSFLRCWLRIPLNNIGFISMDGTRTLSPLYVTIQYTKTTDTASSLQVENSLLLNRPDLWVAGTEYSFGGGLYGKRIEVAQFSSASKAEKNVTIATGVSKIINYGGEVYNITEGWHQVVGTYRNSRTTADNDYSALYYTENNSLVFWFNNDSTRTHNFSIDTWVLYKK